LEGQMKLTATHLYIIADTLNHSLSVAGMFNITREAREETLKEVFKILDKMEVEIVAGKPDPVVINGDVGG
jgi:hypothetical protein